MAVATQLPLGGGSETAVRMMISTTAAAGVAAASLLVGAACGTAVTRYSCPMEPEPEPSVELLLPAVVPTVAQEFDAPGLENRVLRKAETVVRGRTGRFLIVVERCCNSHNYSAIIRTAEACVLRGSPRRHQMPRCHSIA
jgi:hypothetical protein